MSLKRFLAATLVVLSVVACGAVTNAGSVDALTGVAWEATQVGGQPVATAAPVTLSFADGKASGRSGCNRYSGTVTVDAGRIRFSEIMSTKMACAEEGAMMTEMAYLQALSGAEAWSVSGDGLLTISGSKGAILFKPAAPETGRQ